MMMTKSREVIRSQEERRKEKHSAEGRAAGIWIWK
jgi:hypothetical protein